MHFRETMEEKYRELLESYMHDQSEQALYAGQKFSRKTIEQKISPEEIINLHKSLLIEMQPDISEEVLNSFDFLLEVMMGYGLAYREHQSLRHKQEELRSEIEIATNVQQTLLGTAIPNVAGLDIGAISVPARHMNGDYYHFVKDENGYLSVAIADVIGKGIPAALCMSMIKYAMDSLPKNRMDPGGMLENLNRIVEQNVDPSMFITMFYGMFNPETNLLSYASAGHEPGFYYSALEKTYTELTAKGLLLGVEKKATYREYHKEIHRGDMIILLSDGVTECRSEEGFIARETLVNYINKYMDLKAQDIVEKVFKDLEKLQHFQLRDDFTLIILKRNV